jgi:hypothetical protein
VAHASRFAWILWWAESNRYVPACRSLTRIESQLIVLWGRVLRSRPFAHLAEKGAVAVGRPVLEVAKHERRAGDRHPTRPTASVTSDSRIRFICSSQATCCWNPRDLDYHLSDQLQSLPGRWFRSASRRDDPTHDTDAGPADAARFGAAAAQNLVNVADMISFNRVLRKPPDMERV